MSSITRAAHYARVRHIQLQLNERLASVAGRASLEECTGLTAETMQLVCGLSPMAWDRLIAGEANEVVTADVASTLAYHMARYRLSLADVPESYRTRITWEQFAVEGGVSLRALVDAGLYARYSDALKALKASGCGFAVVSSKPGAQGGRPREDHILTSLSEAQAFCAQSRTEAGRRIMQVILEHHKAFQALAARESEALHNLASVHGADVVRLLQDTIADLQARVASLEARPVLPSDAATALDIARVLGWYSRTGKPHTQAVAAVARAFVIGLCDGIYRCDDASGCATVFYSGDALQSLKRACRSLAPCEGENIVYAEGLHWTVFVS